MKQEVQVAASIFPFPLSCETGITFYALYDPEIGGLQLNMRVGERKGGEKTKLMERNKRPRYKAGQDSG
jgi:hypothetical protein